jgi:LuxR family maltose regulon positive regulatory protein
MNEDSLPLIQTKLHQPQIPAGLVARARLSEMLEGYRQRPLTLVSAPAGYGKSTLISSWLQGVDYPNAWVSLDEHDDDLAVFLSYFLAAIQKISPGSMADNRAMLKLPQLPPMKILVGSMLNELNEINDKYVLVFDDYHYIREKSIHALISELLLHPPPTLHLVLGTRSDPQISLANMRAQGKVTEIRAQDLRFTVEEASLLLQNLLSRVVDEDTVTSLAERTEGWVTGLRLAAMAMRYRVGTGSIQGHLSANNRYVSNYLLSEILDSQVKVYADWLVKSSIFERFNAGLLEAVLGSEAEGDVLVINGQVFLEWLESSNMFVIPLDDQGEWYRYHHLFCQFLEQELERRASQKEIIEMHCRASDWYAQNGFVEEALKHALAAGDSPTALELVAHHRHDLMNQDKWNRLDHWLNLFPASTIEDNLDLLMTRAWLAYYLRYDIAGSMYALTLVDALLEDGADDEKESNLISAELAALRSHFLYWETDSEGAVAAAQSAALVGLAGGYQLLGEMDKAEGTLSMALQNGLFQNPSSNARLLFGLCFMYWPHGDLNKLINSAEHLLKLSEQHNMPWSGSYAHYYLGIAHYERNELSKAEEHLGIVYQNPFHYPMQNVGQSAFSLALTYQAQGQLEKAEEVFRAISDLAFEAHNEFFIQLSIILRIELRLLQGHKLAAASWAQDYKPGELKSMHRFYMPELIKIKALLAEGSSSSVDKAAEQLERLLEHAEKNHANIVLIKARSLKALLAETLGDESMAMEELGKAVQMAEPHGIIRPFVDLGPNMAALLKQLHSRGMSDAYIALILKAFKPGEPAAEIVNQKGLIDPLTNRELEILALLAQQLRNKEIADRLVISDGTVRQHTHNIYQKLGVNTRWQAVIKANELGIRLPDP